jgi:ATP-dependent DNA helicase RecG
MGIADAVEAVHYPTSFEVRDEALRRLAFDELLALQVGMVVRDRQRRRAVAERLVVRDQRFVDAIEAIERALTDTVRGRMASLG